LYDLFLARGIQVEGICDVTLPPINNGTSFPFMSEIIQDTELTDVQDPEYQRLLDHADKSQRNVKDDIIEAARRLEDIE